LHENFAQVIFDLFLSLYREINPIFANIFNNSKHDLANFFQQLTFSSEHFVKISALYHLFSGIMGNFSSTIKILFGNLSLYFKWLALKKQRCY